MTEHLHFIGVSTGGSSIMKLFPRWAQILGLDAAIVGRDVPVRAEPHAYREVIEEIRRDERARGALVTTHKVDVFQHAGDLFGELDSYATLCGEVSCISKRDGVLVGHAKDPVTSGQSLRSMLSPGYWVSTGGHVLCLGAGGAGTAITVHLLKEADSPERIVVTDRDAARLDALRAVHARLGRDALVDYHRVEPGTGDELLASLPARSLVVNATGMGKDLPGSPVSDAAAFPDRAVVWELNYRGELEFLAQARRQAGARGLEVHDGWRYFLHGWTEVIAEVFGLEFDDRVFRRLAEAAEPLRPGS